MKYLVKSIEIESRFVVARGWGKGRMGSDCLMHTSFYSRMMKMFWNKRWWLQDTVNVLSAT